jgi:DNA-binding transcriptional ArsR family regulator
VRALAVAPREEYVAGYAAALQDVVLAFQAEVGAEAEDVEVARLAMASPYVEALGALAAGNATVTAIGLAMGKNKSSASRALAVLREAGLVAAYASPDGNERSRPHALTARGRRVVAEAQKERARAARRKVGTPVRGARVASGSVTMARKRV